MNWAMYLVPVLCIGGYYAYFYLLGGKDRFFKAYRSKFGLRVEEELHAVYAGYFAFENSLGNDALSLIGAGKRGAMILVGLTSMGRLVLGHSEAGGKPMAFEQGQAQVIGSTYKANHDKLAGASGKQERSKVIQVTFPGGSVHLELADSAVQALQTWANGGGVPPIATG